MLALSCRPPNPNPSNLRPSLAAYSSQWRIRRTDLFGLGGEGRNSERIAAEIEAVAVIDRALEQGVNLETAPATPAAWTTTVWLWVNAARKILPGNPSTHDRTLRWIAQASGRKPAAAADGLP